MFGLALTLPAAAALVGMPGYLVEGLFARGYFTSADAANSAALLFHYGWGVPAFVLIKILQPAFFARGDTRTPMTYSSDFGGGEHRPRGEPVLHNVGFYGIAIATAAASWIIVVQMGLELSGTDIWRAVGQGVG